MIKKILGIKNVGKFVSYSPKGDTEFRTVTLIFGENGAGKTMLSAILRSLGDADPTCLLERKTVGSLAPPDVVVRVDNANHTFRNGAWDVSAPGLHVFDTTFVNENVYSGEYIGVEHKRNMYKFIVGKTGVQLAAAVDELDAKIRAKNTEIGKAEELIRPHTLGPSSVGEFVNIPTVPDADKSIAEKTAAIAALKEASVIASRAALSRINIPSFPLNDLESLLLRTLEDVAANAERLTREHISSCMDKQGETWVGKGLTYIKGDRCPFCGQPIAGVELIKAYRAFFSESYTALKAKINDARGRVNERFSQQAILGVQSVIGGNHLNAEFWRNYIDIQNPVMNFQELLVVWETLHGLIDEYLRRKEASPLDALQPGDEVKKAFEAYDREAEKVAKHNQDVDAANSLIGQVKQQTAGGNLAVAEGELVALQNAKKRHEDPAVKKLCEEYLTLLKEKKQLDDWANDQIMSRDS